MQIEKSKEIEEIDKQIENLNNQITELYKERRRLEYSDIDSYVGKCYKEDMGIGCDPNIGRYYKIVSIDKRKGGFPNNRYPCVVLYLNNNESLPCIDFMHEYFPFEFCCDEISEIEFIKQKNICLSRLGNKISEVC